jgi:hypothetical protein
MSMQRSGTFKVLRDIEAEMLRTQSIGSMLATLASLVEVAEVAVGNAAPDADRINQLAGYLAEVRHLLGYVRSASGNPAVVLEAGAIAERFRDLEGKVKEMRNDLAAAGK